MRVVMEVLGHSQIALTMNTSSQGFRPWLPRACRRRPRASGQMWVRFPELASGGRF